jgi:hypothetical protein
MKDWVTTSTGTWTLSILCWSCGRRNEGFIVRPPKRPVWEQRGFFCRYCDEANDVELMLHAQAVEYSAQRHGDDGGPVGGDDKR